MSAGLRVLVGELAGVTLIVPYIIGHLSILISVRKWLSARGAPGMHMAGENLGLALLALADRRRGRTPQVYNDLFLIHVFI